MSRILRPALLAVCAFTLLASLYLSASLYVLAPPRADYKRWAITVSLIGVVGLVTLCALAAPA